MTDIRQTTGSKLPPSGNPVPNVRLNEFPLSLLPKPQATPAPTPVKDGMTQQIKNAKKPAQVCLPINYQATLEANVKKANMQGMGFAFIDLQTGKTAGWNANKIFYPASVIKVPVMVEVFRQIDKGKLSLNQVITLRDANIVPSWHPAGDKRPVLQGGMKRTVKELVELMITRSDNSATNTLIDLVGRDKINQSMSQLKLSSIQVHRKLSLASYANEPRQSNKMTPMQTAKLFALISQGKAASPKSCQAMMQILGKQMDDSKIPSLLPKTGIVKCYHKTGETSTTTHDAGIVEIKGKRYVMVEFSQLTPGDETYARFGKLTKDVLQSANLLN